MGMEHLVRPWGCTRWTDANFEEIGKTAYHGSGVEGGPCNLVLNVPRNVNKLQSCLRGSWGI